VFTGIVEELGEVVAVDGLGDSARLRVHGPLTTADAAHGDSIAVNGVCLTVVDVAGEAFATDVMAETLRRTGLGALRPGSKVNLERAARLDSRLGGHLVQGHVDGTGEILERTPSTHWELVRVSLPLELERYVVEKGSVAVDGVSLTVVEVAGRGHERDHQRSWFSVSLIPTTLALTTLGHKQPGDHVNLEVDVLAKYVERLLAARTA
jgi:riboflavin synthase